MEDEKMKKIMDITNRNDVEVWSVEVYREEYLTEENKDTWNFWDDTKYITVEKVLYLLENEDDTYRLMNEYEEKYKNNKGYHVCVTLFNEDMNYCGEIVIK